MKYRFIFNNKIHLMMKNFLLLFIIAGFTSNLLGQTIIGTDSVYTIGDSLIFNYTGGTGDTLDWVGVYPVNEIPDGDPVSLVWRYVKTKAGRVALKANLPNGDYAAHLFCCDGYKILATFKFKIKGTPPATIASATFARADSNIIINYTGGTGSPKDWVGIYKPTDVPGTDQSLLFQYVPADKGTITFKKPALVKGNYVAKLFCCDGYNVLASVNFTVFENLAPSVKFVAAPKLGQPFTIKFTGGTGSLLDWVGIYKRGEKPGVPSSQSFLYVNGVNGELTFAGDILKVGQAYDAHLFCCDDYNILATIDSFRVTASTAVDDLDNQPKLFTTSPSPAYEAFNLVFAEPVTGKFTFYNMSGQAIRQLQVKGESQIEVTNLPAGAYIGQLQSDKGIQAKKIMVLR
jgi:Secretion system C-terminal sorting domain